jgi:hypothetical protein
MSGDPTKNQPWDNAGPRDIGLAKDFAPATQEEAIDAAGEDQKAFDQLGPLTRAAMRESLIRWSSSKCLEQCRKMRQDPRDRRVDAMMAGMIKQAEPGIVAKLRVSDEQAVKIGEREHIQRIIDRASKPRKRAA